MHTLIDTLTVCVCVCVRAWFWQQALERPGRWSLDREGLLTERQPAHTITSSEGGTSVLAGWEGMTHSGRRATQGIPTQVPSCQKESKTQPLRQPSGRWPGQPQQTLPGPASSACSLRAGAWGLCPAPVPPRKAWARLQTRVDAAVAPGFSQLSRAGRTGPTRHSLGLQTPGRVLPPPPTLPKAPSSAPGACSAAWAFLSQAPISAPGHFLMPGAPPLLTGTAGALGHLTSRPLRPGLWENSTQP